MNVLQVLVTILIAKHIEVEERAEWKVSPKEVGISAGILVPEGNPIEFWQPGEE